MSSINRLPVAPVLTDDVWERAAQRQKRSVIHDEPVQAAPVTPVYAGTDEAPDWPQDRIVREFGRLNEMRSKLLARPDHPEIIKNTFNNALAELFGIGGERYKTWPERMAVSAATLPRDVITGAEPMGQTGDRFSEHAIERAQEMAGLSGGAPLMAKPGSATLGTGMIRTGSTKLHPVETTEGWFAHQGEGPGKFGPFKTKAEVDAYIADRGGQGPSAQPFYSAVEAAVREAPDTKMTPEQWGGYLRNRPGVKAEELDWIGLPEGQKVSKQEMLDHAKEHGVQMKEVRKEGNQLPHEDDLHDMAMESVGEYWNSQPTLRKKHNDDIDSWLDSHDGERFYQQALEQAEAEASGEAGTKFSEYQLPGGDNYREVLFTLPPKKVETATKIDIARGEELARMSYDERVKRGVQEEHEKHIDAQDDLGNYVKPLSRSEQPEYRSSHWDEPNVLAHARVNDRTIPDGSLIEHGPRKGEIAPDKGLKTLHLEEIQSDWHQAGRKQGYKPEPYKGRPIEQIEKDIAQINSEIYKQSPESKDYPTVWMKFLDNNLEIKARLNAAWEEKRAWQDFESDPHTKGVPDAPFKTSWPDLVLKRMIREAAENGYDAVSWTPGEAQAARYDLSKQLDNLSVARHSGDKYSIVGDLNNGNRQHNFGTDIPEAKLADYVGKDLAEKIIKNKENQQDFDKPALKVGGEGMKGFYDDMLVKKANALGKKYGAKVEWKDIPSEEKFDVRNEGVPGGDGWIVRENNKQVFKGSQQDAYSYIDQHNVVKAPVFRLTPELRDVAMRKGFPLFSVGSPFPLVPVDHDPFKESK